MALKTMITIHQITQGSDEWKKLRAGLYTGSNAHKLLKYGAIDYSLTESTSFGGNYYTKRGHILEEEAIELYEQIHNERVQRPGFVTNDKYPSCGYSPDGLTENKVIEVKCFNQKRHMEIYNGSIPLTVLAQVHFGMLICEAKLAHLVIYNPELEAEQALRVIPIMANRNITNNFKRILTRERAAV